MFWISLDKAPAEKLFFSTKQDSQDLGSVGKLATESSHRKENLFPLAGPY